MKIELKRFGCSYFWVFLFVLFFGFSNEALASSSKKKLIYNFQLTLYEEDIWLAVPQEHNLQSGIKKIALTPSPTKYYVDPKNGNQLLFYEKMTGEIKGTYELTSCLPMSVQVDPDKIGEYELTSNLYKTYTSSEAWIECDNSLILQQAQLIAGDEKNPFMVAKKIFNFVSSYLEVGNSWADGISPEEVRNGYGALGTYERGTGTCQNYALLFVALCRAAGIPARTVHGMVLAGDLSSYSEPKKDTKLSHAWAEIFFPNYGWIPADPIGYEAGMVGGLGEVPDQTWMSVTTM